MITPTYLSLFVTFFKIGAFTFGGGWAMIAIIERELVIKRAWLNQEEFLNALALSQTLPGILAVNISIFTGNKLFRKRGALCATLGTILPSFLLILAFALYFTRVADNSIVNAVFQAIRPAVVALIIIPVLTSAKAVKLKWQKSWIPLVTVVAVSVFKLSPVFVIVAIIMGSLGWHYQKVRREQQP